MMLMIPIPTPTLTLTHHCATATCCCPTCCCPCCCCRVVFEPERRGQPRNARGAVRRESTEPRSARNAGVSRLRMRLPPGGACVMPRLEALTESATSPNGDGRGPDSRAPPAQTSQRHTCTSEGADDTMAR